MSKTLQQCITDANFHLTGAQQTITEAEPLSASGAADEYDSAAEQLRNAAAECRAAADRAECNARDLRAAEQ